MGWTWFLAGALLGGIVAPYLLNVWGLANTQYEVPALAAIGAVFGFLVQLVGWFVMSILSNLMPTERLRPYLAEERYRSGESRRQLFIVLAFVFGTFLASFLFPLALVGYGVYLYVTTLGAQSGLTTTAVIGGTLIKLAVIFAVPLLRGLVFTLLVGRVIWLLRKVRGR
jgi:hypothetical protein